MRGRLPLAVAMVAIGVVIGFVLGGIAPRREVADREEELAALRAQRSTQGSGWRSPVPGLDRILREPDRQGELPHDVEGVAPAAGAPVDPAEGPPPTAVEVGDGGMPRGRRGDRPRDERMEAFQRAVSIQEVRRVQSRAALLEQADLDEEEMVEVDAALEEMNAELRGYGEELLLLAMGDGPPPARDLLGITHDVTGILHRAQLRVEGVVGPERMQELDPNALQIWNFVDLAQLEPAARTALER